MYICMSTDSCGDVIMLVYKYTKSCILILLAMSKVPVALCMSTLLSATCVHNYNCNSKNARAYNTNLNQGGTV